MNTKYIIALLSLSILFFSCTESNPKIEENYLLNQDPIDYVSILVGTQSKYELSTGNTYPAIARPWGMNFWTPQTRKMGEIGRAHV